LSVRCTLGASVGEFPEVSLSSSDIGFVRSLFGGKFSKVDQFSVDTDRCVPGIDAAFLQSVAPFQSSSRLFPSTAIGGICLTICQTEVGDAIVCANPIDVVDPTSRHFAVAPEPRQPVRSVTEPVNENGAVSGAIHNRSDVSHFSLVTVTSGWPCISEHSSAGVICNDITQPGLRHRNRLWGRQRSRFRYQRRRNPLGKRPMQRLSRGDVRSIAFFFRVVAADVEISALEPNHGLPASIWHLVDTSQTVLAQFPHGIGSILSGGGKPKILDPVIIRDAVDVINDVGRIDAIGVKPRQSMSVPLLLTDGYSTVALFVDSPHGMAETLPIVQGPKHSRCRIIVKNGLKKFYGETVRWWFCHRKLVAKVSPTYKRAR
jgi:hypothetical protein